MLLFGFLATRLLYGVREGETRHFYFLRLLYGVRAGETFVIFHLGFSGYYCVLGFGRGKLSPIFILRFRASFRGPFKKEVDDGIGVENGIARLKTSSRRG